MNSQKSKLIYQELIDALRNDPPNRHDCQAAADAIARLEVFRLGALRLRRDGDLVVYTRNMDKNCFGYWLNLERDCSNLRWAGERVEDAIMLLGYEEVDTDPTRII